MHERYPGAVCTNEIFFIVYSIIAGGIINSESFAVVCYNKINIKLMPHKIDKFWLKLKAEIDSYILYFDRNYDF